MVTLPQFYFTFETKEISSEANTQQAPKWLGKFNWISFPYITPETGASPDVACVL